VKGNNLSISLFAGSPAQNLELRRCHSLRLRQSLRWTGSILYPLVAICRCNRADGRRHNARLSRSRSILDPHFFLDTVLLFLRLLDLSIRNLRRPFRLPLLLLKQFLVCRSLLRLRGW